MKRRETRLFISCIVIASWLSPLSSKASISINDDLPSKFLWSAIAGVTIADNLEERGDRSKTITQTLTTASGSCLLLSSGKEIIDEAMRNGFSATDIIIYAAGCTSGSAVSRLTGDNILVMPNLVPNGVNDETNYGIIFQIVF